MALRYAEIMASGKYLGINVENLSICNNNARPIYYTSSLSVSNVKFNNVSICNNTLYEASAGGLIFNPVPFNSFVQFDGKVENLTLENFAINNNKFVVNDKAYYEKPGLTRCSSPVFITTNVTNLQLKNFEMSNNGTENNTPYH